MLHTDWLLTYNNKPVPGKNILTAVFKKKKSKNKKNKERCDSIRSKKKQKKKTRNLTLYATLSDEVSNGLRGLHASDLMFNSDMFLRTKQFFILPKM